MSWKDAQLNPVLEMIKLKLTNPLTGKKRKTSNNITWGDLKALNDEASRMMQHVGAEPNATNAFLAYLAIVSANMEIRSLLYLLIFSPCIMIVSAQIYWAHVYDPLVFCPVTWWDLEVPISNNNSKILGGVWVPLSGSLINGTNLLSVEGNQTFVTDSYPLCLTIFSNSNCTPFTSYMHLMKITTGEKGYLTSNGTSKD